MAMTVRDILMDAGAFKRAYPSTARQEGIMTSTIAYLTTRDSLVADPGLTVCDIDRPGDLLALDVDLSVERTNSLGEHYPDLDRAQAVLAEHGWKVDSYWVYDKGYWAVRVTRA